MEDEVGADGQDRSSGRERQQMFLDLFPLQPRVHEEGHEAKSCRGLGTQSRQAGRRDKVHHGGHTLGGLNTSEHTPSKTTIMSRSISKGDWVKAVKLVCSSYCFSFGCMAVCP